MLKLLGRNAWCSCFIHRIAPRRKSSWGGAAKEVPLGGASHATRVTAVFTPKNRACMLELMHDGLPAEHAAHMQARWTGMLYGLGVVLARDITGI